MIKFRRILQSFIYAYRGLIKTFREEQNLKIQSTVGVIVVILGFLFKISHVEWALLVITIGIVVIMEITNSAVERITDVLKPRINNYVKEIKDIMAAAVMLSSIIATIVGLIIFVPYICAICQGYLAL